MEGFYQKEIEECAGLSWPQFQSYWSKKRKCGELHQMSPTEYTLFLKEQWKLSSNQVFIVKKNQRKKVRTPFQNFQAQECAKFPPGTGNHLMEVNRRWRLLSEEEKATYASEQVVQEPVQRRRKPRKEKDQVKSLSGIQLFIAVMTLAYANNGHRLSAPQVAELSPWSEADQGYWNSTFISGNKQERDEQVSQLAQCYA